MLNERNQSQQTSKKHIRRLPIKRCSNKFPFLVSPKHLEAIISKLEIIQCNSHTKKEKALKQMQSLWKNDERGILSVKTPDSNKPTTSGGLPWKHNNFPQNTCGQQRSSHHWCSSFIQPLMWSQTSTTRSYFTEALGEFQLTYEESSVRERIHQALKGTHGPSGWKRMASCDWPETTNVFGM